MRPTSRAVGLFLGGALLAFLAAALGSTTLAGLASMAVLAPVVGAAWVLVHHSQARSADLHRRVFPDHPRAGEWARVEFTPTRGKLPAWVSVRERVSGGRADVTGTGSAYRIRPERRGVLLLGPSVLTVRDPLGLLTWTHTGQRRARVTVWPQTADLFDAVRLWPDDSQLSDTAGRRQSSLDSVSLRDYQAGDDLRRVHWRASAHQGTLVVRPDEPRLDESVSLLVLLAGGAHDADAVEWTVSAAASWARALLTVGYPVSLYLSPGPDGRTMSEPAEAMDAFAVADTHTPHLPLPTGRGALIAVALSPTRPELQDLAGLGQGRDCRALVVDGSARDLDQLAQAGWLVHATPSKADITTTWSQALTGWSHQ